VPKIIINSTINLLCKTAISTLVIYFQTLTVSECCLIKLLPYILLENIYLYSCIGALVRSGNQHCADIVSAQFRSVCATKKNDTERLLACCSAVKLLWSVQHPIGDWCQQTYIGCCRQICDNLQRVLNAAARAITGTRKFYFGLGQVLHDQLHWLYVPDLVLFKLAVTVPQSAHG